MDENLIENKIPEDFRRRIVDCINIALNDDLPRYLKEFHPDTTNGIPHQIGDWINTNLKKYLVGNSIHVLEFKRYSWKGKVIIDEENKVTYTITRSKRIEQLRNEKRDKPHYLQSIVGVLNAEFIATFKQMTLEGIEIEKFEQDVLEKDCESIFNGSINKENDFVHYVIAYETEHNEIIDIKVCLLDKDFDIVDELSLNDYIKPDFAKLTSSSEGEPNPINETVLPNEGLISLKSKSILKLKEAEKQG